MSKEKIEKIIKLIISIARIIIFFLLLLLWSLKEEKISDKENFIFCPIRKRNDIKKKDERGLYTEEYYRIKLIKSFIKSGISKENIALEYRIKIGHKGRNLLIPDIVIKKRKKEGVFLVVEIKKNSKDVKGAVEYQLKPATRILKSDYGIYYDGTMKSFIFERNGNIIKNFDFMNIPMWFIYEWKYS